MIFIKDSEFILNDKYIKIESINYKDELLSIKTINDSILNISLNFDITKLQDGIRRNIAKKIYFDHNFITKNYSYSFNIGNNVYLTKKKNNYLLEINIPKVEVLIPPFDNINNKRLESINYDEQEIKKLEIKIYFKINN